MSATNKRVRIEEHSANQCAAVDQMVSLLGEKWTVLVLGVLRREPALRYNELQRRSHGISQRMLTLTLKKLEENGLVTRTLYPSVPPRVDYALTPLGRSLIEPVRALLYWTIDNRPALEAARRSYARSSKKTA